MSADMYFEHTGEHDPDESLETSWQIFLAEAHETNLEKFRAGIKERIGLPRPGAGMKWAFFQFEPDPATVAGDVRQVLMMVSEETREESGSTQPWPYTVRVVTNERFSAQWGEQWLGEDMVLTAMHRAQYFVDALTLPIARSKSQQLFVPIINFRGRQPQLSANFRPLPYGIHCIDQHCQDWPPLPFGETWYLEDRVDALAIGQRVLDEVMAHTPILTGDYPIRIESNEPPIPYDIHNN